MQTEFARQFRAAPATNAHRLMQGSLGSCLEGNIDQLFACPRAARGRHREAMSDASFERGLQTACRMFERLRSFLGLADRFGQVATADDPPPFVGATKSERITIGTQRGLTCLARRFQLRSRVDAAWLSAFRT